MRVDIFPEDYPFTDEQRAAALPFSRPALWAECYPNAYVEDHRYFSPKSIAVDLCLLLGLVDGYVEQGHQIIEADGLALEAVAAAHIVAAGVPTYFVRAEQLDTLRKELAGRTINWADTELPVDAAAFVLPRGAVIHPIYGDARFVWFAKLHESSTVKRSVGTLQNPCRGDVLVIRTSFGVPNSTKIHPIRVAFNDEDDPDVTFADAEGELSSESEDEEASDDAAIMEQLMTVVFGMLSVLDRDPNQVDRGTLTVPEGPSPVERQHWKDVASLLAEIGVPDIPTTKEVGRNDPCPCGSGKKYKKCHGSSRVGDPANTTPNVSKQSAALLKQCKLLATIAADQDVSDTAHPRVSFIDRILDSESGAFLKTLDSVTVFEFADITARCETLLADEMDVWRQVRSNYLIVPFLPRVWMESCAPTTRPDLANFGALVEFTDSDPVTIKGASAETSVLANLHLMMERRTGEIVKFHTVLCVPLDNAGLPVRQANGGVPIIGVAPQDAVPLQGLVDPLLLALNVASLPSIVPRVLGSIRIPVQIVDVVPSHELDTQHVSSSSRKQPLVRYKRLSLIPLTREG